MTNKWTRDEMREWIDIVATNLEEWNAIVGDPLEDGSDLDDLKKVIVETSARLSRFSFSLLTRGMEAAETDL
jgi:hypothetical protein